MYYGKGAGVPWLWFRDGGHSLIAEGLWPPLCIILVENITKGV